MDLTWLDEIDPALLREFLRAVRAADGRPRVDPDAALPHEFRGGRHVVAADGDRLLGYGHLDTGGDAFGRQVAEVLVHPEARGRGLGTALVAEIRAHAPADVRFWAHGDHPGAARIAERLGLSRVRELWQMRMEFGEPLPAPVWPDGVSVRAFVPGQDEDAVVAVNKRAFDWHPEQGALTAADVIATEAEAWFDPAGFFLAVDSADRVLGFHWTKVHPDGTGEVYVVGVDPAAQGGGLGRALTLAGLAHLREQGRRTVILYVESDNAPAVAVYRRLGFTRSDADIQYAAVPPNGA
ncbi:mycothiol synthase [Actinokineospora sp. UTMC 2448]|uniref:mycothiol synthase n=1 Tax=Actinokineospora sp. UTMC 2448 TaxID=2268449 RepID=UPI002200FF34|nr:Mycothiol acetyltransferase [Actinokineospora sp. UTMC 2448]